MARAVDPAKPGLIVELGPGTGPVTKALIARGVRRERLVLVEYDPYFCKLLAERFALIRVVRGDAYALRAALAGRVDAAGRRRGVEPAAAQRAAGAPPRLARRGV